MRGFVVYKTLPINIQDKAVMPMRKPRATDFEHSQRSWWHGSWRKRYPLMPGI
jgi:hypothetical protein